MAKINECTLDALDKKAFEEHGYVIIRDVFSEEEAEDIRARIDRTHKKSKTPRTDLMSYPELKHILADDRIVKIMKLLQNNEPVYHGFSSYRCSDIEYPTVWHHDKKGTVEDPAEIPTFNPEDSHTWPIIQLCVYLQDHSKHSGGIKIRDKSHKNFLGTPINFLRLLSPFHNFKPKHLPLGKVINVPSTKRDIVVMNLAMHHSGHFFRPKLFPNLVLPVNVEKILKRLFGYALFKPIEKKRNLLFITCGRKSDPRTGAFLTNRAFYRTNIGHWKHSTFDKPENVKMLEKKGIIVDTRPMKYYRMFRENDKK